MEGIRQTKPQGPLLELAELVGIPLQALAGTNNALGAGALDILAAMGESAAEELGGSVNLKTIELVYDRLRGGAEEPLVTDTISLEIPLLSLCPVNTMQVKTAKIDFAVAVREVQMVDEKPRLMAEMAGETREKGDRAPRINFAIEVQCAPPAEGLARFMDTLNASAVPKQRASTPLDDKGHALEGAALASFEKGRRLLEKEQRLQQHTAEAAELLRLKTGELKLLTGMDADAYERSLNGAPPPEETRALLESIEDYREIHKRMRLGLARLRAQRLELQMEEE